MRKNANKKPYVFYNEFPRRRHNETSRRLNDNHLGRCGKTCGTNNNTSRVIWNNRCFRRLDKVVYGTVVRFLPITVLTKDSTSGEIRRPTKQIRNILVVRREKGRFEKTVIDLDFLESIAVVIKGVKPWIQTRSNVKVNVVALSPTFTEFVTDVRPEVYRP